MEIKRNYINGAWVEGKESYKNINPSNLSDEIGIYTRADADQTDTAINAADDAFPKWAQISPQARSDALDFIGTEILARKQELGTMLAREEGKTLPEAVGEVNRAGQIFKFFSGEALRIPGEQIASVRPGVTVEVTREPVGVVGIITPWNFPIAIPAWKIAPALAYGNCVVFKPAEIVPGSAWLLADIISRAGLPAGVFNLVMGKGSQVGQRILENDKVNAITFTGSVGTGEKVLMAAAKRRAKVQLEMGGKNPLIVLDDADLAIAVNCAVQGAYFSTGQRCTASSRLIVQKGIYPKFLEAIKERLSSLKIDDALKAGTDIGPVVDQTQFDQNINYIEIGKKEGAKLVAGGAKLERGQKGFYFQPALFTDTDNSMRINREEIFGPVASIITVNNYEEALALSNDTEFGLTAGICTASLKYATHFKRNADVGMAMVNLPTAGVDYHVPFGGRKSSSYGPREQGAYAVEFFTTVKTSYTTA